MGKKKDCTSKLQLSAMKKLLMVVVLLCFQPLWAFAEPPTEDKCSFYDGFGIDNEDTGPQHGGDIVLTCHSNTRKRTVRVEYTNARCVEIALPKDGAGSIQVYGWTGDNCSQFRERGESLLSLSSAKKTTVPICFDVESVLEDGCLEQSAYKNNPEFFNFRFRHLLVVAAQLKKKNRLTEALQVFRQAEKCAGLDVYKKSLRPIAESLDEWMNNDVYQQRVRFVVDSLKQQVDDDEIQPEEIKKYLLAGKVPFPICLRVREDLVKNGFRATSSALPYLRLAEACGLGAYKDNIKLFEKWLDGAELDFASIEESLLDQSISEPICFDIDEIVKAYGVDEPAQDDALCYQSLIAGVLVKLNRLPEALHILRQAEKTCSINSRNWITQHIDFLNQWLADGIEAGAYIDHKKIEEFLKAENLSPPLDIIRLFHSYNEDVTYDEAVYAFVVLSSKSKEGMLTALSKEFSDVKSGDKNKPLAKIQNEIRSGIRILLAMHFLRNKSESEALQVVMEHMDIVKPAAQFEMLATLAVALSEVTDRHGNLELAIGYLKKSIKLEWSKEKAEKIIHHYMQLGIK